MSQDIFESVERGYSATVKSADLLNMSGVWPDSQWRLECILGMEFHVPQGLSEMVNRLMSQCHAWGCRHMMSYDRAAFLIETVQQLSSIRCIVYLYRGRHKKVLADFTLWYHPFLAVAIARTFCIALYTMPYLLNEIGWTRTQVRVKSTPHGSDWAG